MGALEGSLSFKTYYVEAEPPNDFHENYLSRLQKNVFEPLSPVGEDERRIGWVPVQDPLATEFTRQDVFFNQYILFGLRIDKWSIPSSWYKAMFRQALAEAYPDPSVKVSKRAKDEVKLKVTTEIKQKILPSMKVVDVLWNISECRLRFWSNADVLCEEFAEFFEESFGLKLTPDSPYMMAKHLGTSEDELNALVDMEPWHPNMTR